MSEKISSLQNAKVKNVVRLQEKSQERRLQKKFVVEGVNEIRHVLQSSLTIDSVFICPEINSQFAQSEFNEATLLEVTPEVFSKMAYREDSGGVLLVVDMPDDKLDSLKLSYCPLVVVLEAVEKPGNLGAILRTADAAGVDAVLICDPRTDKWNPNVIRSSIGCVFTVPVITCTNDEALDFLKKNEIAVYAAALPGSHRHDHSEFVSPSAIILGTEADGLSEFWIDHADRVIRIPMLGKADSLNVSTSCAIIVFEAMRQRGFNVFESKEKFDAFHLK